MSFIISFLGLNDYQRYFISHVMIMSCHDQLRSCKRIMNALLTYPTAKQPLIPFAPSPPYIFFHYFHSPHLFSILSLEFIELPCQILCNNAGVLLRFGTAGATFADVLPPPPQQQLPSSRGFQGLTLSELSDTLKDSPLTIIDKACVSSKHNKTPPFPNPCLFP